jgi:hypothetical protein
VCKLSQRHKRIWSIWLPFVNHNSVRELPQIDRQLGWHQGQSRGFHDRDHLLKLSQRINCHGQVQCARDNDGELHHLPQSGLPKLATCRVSHQCFRDFWLHELPQRNESDR